MSRPVSEFATLQLPAETTVVAPDGSNVRVLLGLAAGTMAHFELPAGMTSSAVVHRTVEEIWFVVTGRGEMWRKQGEREEIVDLAPGTCLTLPLGTQFQFRASTDRGGCGRRHHHAALAGCRRSDRRVRSVDRRRRLGPDFSVMRSAERSRRHR